MAACAAAAMRRANQSVRYGPVQFNEYIGGTAVGVAGVAAGFHGLSAAGMTSGLAALGLGSMATGIAGVAAIPVTTGAAGYFLRRKVRSALRKAIARNADGSNTD